MIHAHPNKNEPTNLAMSNKQPSPWSCCPSESTLMVLYKNVSKKLEQLRLELEVYLYA